MSPPSGTLGQVGGSSQSHPGAAQHLSHERPRPEASLGQEHVVPLHWGFGRPLLPP